MEKGHLPVKGICRNRQVPSSDAKGSFFRSKSHQILATVRKIIISIGCTLHKMNSQTVSYRQNCQIKFVELRDTERARYIAMNHRNSNTHTHTQSADIAQLHIRKELAKEGHNKTVWRNE